MRHRRYKVSAIPGGTPGLVCFLQRQGGVRLESHRVFGLDVMRTSAIALVLFSHVTLWFANYDSIFSLGLLAGYFGVEIFFVLSGFLIGGILLRSLTDESSTFTLAGFWQRRWLRTLPNYFLFLGVNFVLAAWLFHSTPSVLPYVFFAQNITARAPGFFVESWSLAVEEWFYILLPVFFLLALRISPRRFRASSLIVIFGVIAGVTIARTVYAFAAHPVWLTGVRMIVIYRLDACMFGVFAAWISHFSPASWERVPRATFLAGLLILCGFGIATCFLPTDSLVLETLGFSFTSFAAALLLPLLSRWTLPVRSSNPVVRMSVWSYSLYLVNLPVFAVIFCHRQYFGRLGCAATFLFGSITLAALIYRFFEKPLMDLRERSASPHRALEAVPALVERGVLQLKTADGIAVK